jgi:peptidylglycine monooxygenase
MNTAHHILIYGCKIPGYHERDTPRVVWDCGEMAKSNTEFVKAPTCASGSEIVYAWAMDAPALVLPEGNTELGNLKIFLLFCTEYFV